MNKCTITGFPTNNIYKGKRIHPNIVELAIARRDVGLLPKDKGLVVFENTPRAQLKYLHQDLKLASALWGPMNSKSFTEKLNEWLTKHRAEVEKQLELINAG